MSPARNETRRMRPEQRDRSRTHAAKTQTIARKRQRAQKGQAR